MATVASIRGVITASCVDRLLLAIPSCLLMKIYYATKASWIQPLHILADEYLNGTNFIVVSPARGGGCRKGDWSLDAGISVYDALYIHHNDKEKNEPQQEQPNSENKPRNKTNPGFR